MWSTGVWPTPGRGFTLGWRFAAVPQRDPDRGESEAIALAVEAQATLLIDEKDGRNAARRAGLNTLGVLGFLIRAKEMREIARVKPEIAALRVHAGFFIGAALERAVLVSAGEG